MNLALGNEAKQMEPKVHLFICVAMHIFPTLQICLNTGRTKNHEQGWEGTFSLRSPDTP